MILIEEKYLSFNYVLGFPCGSADKESTFNERDLGSKPGLGRSPGEGKGYLLQYSGLENSMDCIFHEVAKSQTRLSNFHFHFLTVFSTQFNFLLKLFNSVSCFLGILQVIKPLMDKAQAGIKIAKRSINNLRYADDTTLMAESKKELKSILMKMKEESEKAGLKLNILKTKIMASSPITSWQMNGETMETVTDFIFLSSIITADLKFHCSHEIKRHLFLGRKAMANLNSIL